MSIPTSGYSMEASPLWHQTMSQWVETMNGLQVFRGELKDIDVQNVPQVAYDFSLLDQARDKLAQRTNAN